MRTMFIKVVFLAAILAIAGSCSLYKDYEASRPANVMKIESHLDQAGFRRIPIETPEQNGAVEQLPLYRLNRYQSAEGSVFWYADPTVCSCLYQGDQMAFERYVGQLQQERDTAEYMDDERSEQVAYLSPFGSAFPPPLILGGWPVVIPGGGPIQLGGGHIYSGGGPIQSRGGGGGGGIHSGGGHGGGHGIGGHGGGHR